MIKWCLLLSVVCLHFSTYLSPSHKSATHAAVSPPPPPGRSVHPLCLTPLAFIRTVDGSLQKSLQRACTQTEGSVAICAGKTRVTFTDCRELALREVRENRKKHIHLKLRAGRSSARWGSKSGLLHHIFWFGERLPNIHYECVCLWRPSLCH